MLKPPTTTALASCSALEVGCRIVLHQMLTFILNRETDERATEKCNRNVKEYLLAELSYSVLTMCLGILT